MPENVIIGTGVSGMLCGAILARKGQKVILVDKNKEIGGLLRKFDYGVHGIFDYGMHNYLETGIREIDDLIFSLLPEKEWQILSGAKRDIAGIFFNGRLQKNTPYIDLRNFEAEKYKQLLSELFVHFDKTSGQSLKASDYTSAKDFAIKRFGEEVAMNTVIPVVEKIHKIPADQLDYMGTIFTPLTRLAVFEEKLADELSKSDFLRDKIAYTEQRNLPLERSSGRKGFYPKKYGIYRIIEGLQKIILDNGGEILNDAEVKSVEHQAKRISKVMVQQGNRSIELNPDKFIWTGNIPLLARYLNCDFSGLKQDKPLKTIVVNILVSQKLLMDDLYYFFCYDPSYHTYRLTDFTNYCEGAPRNGYYPIAMELLMKEDDMKKYPSIEKLAIEELERFGLLKPGTQIGFAKAEILDSGFPLPSLNNINGMKNLRNQVKSLSLENLVLTGILAEDNLFFQTDVLIDAFKKTDK